MGPLALRRANETDAAFIMQCFGLPHARAFMRMPEHDRIIASLARDDLTNYMITDDGAPVGNILLRDLAGPRIIEIGQIVVAQARRGYGRFALEFAKRWAFEERGAHRLCLEVVAENTPARKLYEACGFTHEGTFRHGFPADDGGYRDLAAYGMLDHEHRATR